MYLDCHAAVLASSPISQEAFEKLALNSLKSWILATMRHQLYFGVNGHFDCRIAIHRNAVFCHEGFHS
jgi:hypothetical protein